MGGNAHNAWWYHSPGGSKRYLFVGEEGPGGVGSSSSGDIHVVDVSNLAAPVEVGIYHLPGAGTHNFWVDEANEILDKLVERGELATIDPGVVEHLDAFETEGLAPFLPRWQALDALLGQSVRLVEGDTDAACASAKTQPAGDADWLPLRATCATLGGDANASLLVEQIARTFGVDWAHFGAQVISFAIVCSCMFDVPS